MYPKLLHIYGPIDLHSYSLALAIGLFVFAIFALRDPRRKSIISKEDFINLIVESALVGIISARALHVISDYKNYSLADMFKIWEGGLSALGGVFGVLIYCAWQLRKKKISAFALLDLAAIYAPLLYAIVRIGCFFEGCCFGSPTDLFCGVIYTNPDSVAPLHVKIHPSQIYASSFSLIVFLFMYYIARNRKFFPGELMMCYLMSLGVERLIVDFFRGDRIEVGFEFFGLNFLSFYQWISLVLFLFAFIALVVIKFTNRRSYDI